MISMSDAMPLEDAILLKKTLRLLEEKIKEQLNENRKYNINNINNNNNNASSNNNNDKGHFLNNLRWEDSLASSASTQPCRPDKVIVFVKIVILKLGDIDTMRDKFSADVFIQCKWREPALDGKMSTFIQQNESIDWDVYWNPRLTLENVIGEPKEQLWHTVTFDNLGQAIVCEKRRVTGAFLEFMELYQFPFDTQDLSVSVMSNRDQNEVELAEDPKERCLLNVMSFADVQEWRLHDGCTTWKDVREENFKNSSKKKPSFGASCKVSRRPQFFVWNIFIVLTLICSLSFATFSVSFTSPQNRLQLTFTLLLTTVSFKFVAYQSLPTIAYLTYLDRYILGLMGILSIICMWHALAYYIYTATNCNQSLVSSLDLCACAFFASLYLLFHVAFACVVACVKKDSAGHGVPTTTSDDMTFNEDYAEDYSLPFQDLRPDDNNHPSEDTSHVTANNQTVMAACGME